MKKEELFDIIGEIDENKVVEAGKVMYEKNKTKRNLNKTMMLAACFCLIIVAVLAVGVSRGGWQKTSVLTQATESALLSDATKPASEIGENLLSTTVINNSTGSVATTPALDIPQTEPALDIPQTEATTYHMLYPSILVSTTVIPEYYSEIDWDRRVMPGKFRALIVEGREYVYPFRVTEKRANSRKATKMISEKQIEGSEPDGTVHKAVVDVFSLDGFDKRLALGVKFADEENVYVYINPSYVPATLDEFLTATDYNNTVTYGNIELYRAGRFPVNSANVADIGEYLFVDKSVKNNPSANPTGYRVTVTVSCDELGHNNKVLYIYEDGHIATNLLGYECIFFVGKKNVADFLKNSYNVTYEQLKEVENNLNTASETTSWSKTTVVYSQAHMPE